MLDAPLACTRKVADRGWLPRSRQVGLTGHHVAPRLYVAIGLRGGFNHTIGIRRSHVVFAINSDAAAPIFDDADIGIVGDWRDAVPLLAQQLMSRDVTAMIGKRGHARCAESSCAGA
jgi:electron transfer flavoprotein alpha subunit